MISQILETVLLMDILKKVIFNKEHTNAENQTLNNLKLEKKMNLFMVVIFYLLIRFFKCNQLILENWKIGAST